MARANPSARKLLADAVAPVVKAHGGPPKVAPKVGRDRTTVYRWTKGDIDWDGLTALASGTRTDIVITFPAHGQPKVKAKTPPEPDWLEGLEDRIAERLEARLIGKESIPDRVADRIATRLGLPRPPSDEADAEASGAPVDTANTERQPKG